MTDPLDRQVTFRDMIALDDWENADRSDRVGDHRSKRQWLIDRATASACADAGKANTAARAAGHGSQTSNGSDAAAPASAPSASGTGSGGGSSAAELFLRLREALAEERWNLPDADYQTSDCRFVMDTRLAIDAILAAHEAGDVGDIVALNANHAAALEAMVKRAEEAEKDAAYWMEETSRFSENGDYWRSRVTAAEAKCKEMEASAERNHVSTIDRLATLERQLDEERAQFRPEIRAFAALMERELRANDHKPGWKSDHARVLLLRLREEADELSDVLDDPKLKTNRTMIGKEAADVANFAMMIADVCGGLSAARLVQKFGGAT